MRHLFFSAVRYFNPSHVSFHTYIFFGQEALHPYIYTEGCINDTPTEYQENVKKYVNILKSVLEILRIVEVWSEFQNRLHPLNRHEGIERN